MFSPLRQVVLIDFRIVASQSAARSVSRKNSGLPYGNGAYMAPERLLGVADASRARPFFHWGVLLVLFTTGVRPFGETETCALRRRCGATRILRANSSRITALAAGSTCCGVWRSTGVAPTPRQHNWHSN